MRRTLPRRCLAIRKGHALTRLLLLLAAALAGAPAQAQVRIKDIADVEGVRDNQLVGYGLVGRSACDAARAYGGRIVVAERHAGRQRHERWGSRTLDVDILLYNGAVIDAPNLTVPHPRLPLRRFALVPLAEIAATAIHPQLHQTIGELLRCCPDPLAVRLWGST